MFLCWQVLHWLIIHRQQEMHTAVWISEPVAKQNQINYITYISDDTHIGTSACLWSTYPIKKNLVLMCFKTLVNAPKKRNLL